LKEDVPAAEKYIIDKRRVEPYAHAPKVFSHFLKNILGLAAREKIPENFFLRISEPGPMRVFGSISEALELVILSAFRRIGKNAVRLVYFLETLFGPRIAGISVRVRLQSQFAVRFFYLFGRGVRGDTQSFIVVTIGHSAIFPGFFPDYITMNIVLTRWNGNIT
jgi:hypothetical protein